MKNKFQTTPRSLGGNSLTFGSARLHARIARQLIQTTGNAPARFAPAQNLFGSLWSPLRLDLLKIPLTRHRE